MPGKQKTGPEAIARRERQDRALDLRKRGYTYARIGEQLGVDRTTAYHYVADALREITRENAEEVLDLTLGRLDAAIAAIWPKVEEGDLDAIDRLAKLEDRRARLFGLYKLAEQKIAGEGRELSAVDQFLAEVLGDKIGDGDPIDENEIRAELAAVRPSAGGDA